MMERDTISKLKERIGELEAAIARLQAERTTLGDAATELALSALRRQLSALRQAADAEPATSPRGPQVASLEGERRQVTVMFADISGFTAMSETMDPEAVRDLINACFERLVPAIERYGGTVDKFLGDGIMALYGAPVAHENDPERALRAALEMVRELEAFNHEREMDLGIHFGINTGLVIAGGIGTRGRRQYSVMGDTVNLASRLEDVSERGEILVGPDTYRLTRPLFRFEAQQPVRVKGKAEPVRVHRLVGLAAQPGRVRGLESRGIHSPLVGRDAELAAVRCCVERTLNGQGGIVSLIGEAGVGKSRLMAEILGSLGEDLRGLLWLEGRALSFGQTISYLPFQEILWRYAGIAEDDSESAAWGKLEGRVGALFGADTPEILPYLASLLTLEVKDEYAERVKYLDGEAMGRQVFLASRRFFERLARRQPVVLVFEDLHWVDESSARLLEHLLPLVRDVPLLVISVSRPHRQGPAARLQEAVDRDYAQHCTDVRLVPLSQAESAQLARNLLAIEYLPPRIRETIVRKAEGNPFYLEEIIRALIGAGAVTRDPTTGRWQTTARVETITIPDTIQGVVMARLDRLDEDVKQVLRTAAVIGRSFLHRVLRAVIQADRQLDSHLAELQAIELVRERRRMPELEYMFKHTLAQEVTYESILIKRRQELHDQVGRAIETLFADRLEEFYGLLAYHYAQARVWDRAQDYLLKAGDQAGRVAADAEALAHYERAMAAYARASGERWDPLQRATLERKMGEALFRRGEHPQALDRLHRALDDLGRPLPTARWGALPVLLREIVEQIGHRLLPRFLLRRSDGPVSPAVELEVHCYEPIGWIEAFTRPERLLLVTLRGLNVSERHGFSYGAAMASTGLGYVMDFIPLFGLASDYHRRAVGLAEEIQHPRALGLAYIGLAAHEGYVGEGRAAIERSSQAAEICHGTGDLHGWGQAMQCLAANLGYRGDLERSLSHSQETARLGQEGADPQVHCWGLSRQGFSLRRLGRLDKAVAVLARASELAKTVPDYATQVEAGGELGRCYLCQGKLEEALSALHASRQVCDEHGAGWGTSTPLRNGLAEAYLVAAEQGALPRPSAGGDWLGRARRACREALKQGKAFRPGLPEAMRLRGTYEWLRGKPAAADKWWRRGLALAGEMGQPYDAGLIHLEMGRRLGERAHLERTEALLSEIGAAWDLARVRELLAAGG